MNLYLLRHGMAEDTAPDADRRLTAKGKENLRRVLTAAKRSGVAPELILTSPLRRARESAGIASEALDCRRVKESPNLLPAADPAELWKELVELPCQEVLVAGHEPHLSAFLIFLLGNSFAVDFKKGALARVDVRKRSGSPSGVLKWFLTPKLAQR